MSDPVPIGGLGAALRRERKARHLSLRDLAVEIDVSFNTLSRVERGYLPDLTNYNRIVKWLGVPASTFLESNKSVAPTPDVIAKHLFADPNLSVEGASRIASLVQELYNSLAEPRPAYSVHLRSAKTFLPDAGNALGQLLEDMHDRLAQESH